jgi:pyruvate formate-lyase activating enzyme-like uncharacterized protein
MPIKFTGALLDSSKGRPPLGCRYCDRGAKMVLYITGICKQECYYCPLSEKKKDRDVIHANERPVNGREWMDQVIDEAKRMKSLGTGITGGDPMVVPERTAALIRRLKAEFGKGYHIHLYTTGPFDPDLLHIMKEAGLDEIRFHPPLHTWEYFRYLGEHAREGDGSIALQYHELIMEAKRSIPNVGLEIPAVVEERGSGGSNSKGLLELVRYAVRNELDFVNINELEASHTNMTQFAEKGFELVGDSMAVNGSRELAWSVIDKIENEFPDSKTTLHFCSSVYKDSIQLRHRLIRMAKNLQKEYEIVTNDGTFLRGVIESDHTDSLRKRLIEEFNVPSNLIEIKGGKVFIAPWILEEIGPELEKMCYISEVYPTWDGLEVERIPIE